MARKPKVDYRNLPDTDECIDHCQKGNIDGYGHIGSRRLHRAVYEYYYKSMPKLVMHKCDNPRCINPKHLQAGDWNLNNKDRSEKGRSAKAVQSRRKISSRNAAFIRFAYSPVHGSVFGVTRLAKMFSVDAGTIYNIINGRTHTA